MLKRAQCGTAGLRERVTELQDVLTEAKSAREMIKVNTQSSPLPSSSIKVLNVTHFAHLSHQSSRRAEPGFVIPSINVHQQEPITRTFLYETSPTLQTEEMNSLSKQKTASICVLRIV